MPRRSQLGSGGVIFHVLNRGAFRSRLFTQRTDYQAFIDVVAEGLERHPVRLLALSIMPTHWHLVIWPVGDEDLSRFMAWVTTTHAQRWRRTGGTVGEGAVYQGRFKSIPVQSDTHLLVLLWYVERNAVRAGLVSKAEDWRWSSASEGCRNCSTLSLTPWPILRPRGWLSLLNSGEPPCGIEPVRAAIARGRPFGDEKWQATTAARLGLGHTLRERGGWRTADGTAVEPTPAADECLAPPMLILADSEAGA